MRAKKQLEPTPQKTLGDVLYAAPKALIYEEDWVALVRAVASSDQLALHALYERSNRLVFTLGFRITGNRETAEEVTLDVFHDVWRRAGSYDPANGTVLGWVMNLARSRAIDRHRFDQRQKRAQPSSNAGETLAGAAGGDEALESKEASQTMRAAMAGLTSDERQAIEAAYFAEVSYAEAATALAQPVGTIKTRIRSGLQKLRQTLAAEVKKR